MAPPGFRPWLSRITAALALLLAFGVSQALAQRVDPVFSVGNIPIEATDADPVKARDKALLEGDVKAFDLLMRRIVAEPDIAKLPALEAEQIQAMVAGFEFAAERTTSTRYAALLTVVFVPDQIKAWLRSLGVGFVDASGPPMLVIPLVKGRAGVAPFEERGEWRDIWTRVAGGGGLIPTRTLRGDEPDRNLATPEQVFVGDMDAIGKLAKRHGLKRVLVSLATKDGDAPPTITGTLYDLATGDKVVLARTVAAEAAQQVDAAVAQRTRVERDWKQVAAVSRDWANAVEFVVPIRQLEEWVLIRRRLASSPTIRTVDVKSLEQERALVRLEHFGGRDQLDKALAQISLGLVDRGGQLTLVTK